jgi:hypothetical protein
LVSEWHLDEAIYDTLRSQPSEARATLKTAVRQPARSPVRLRRRLFPWLVWHEARISLTWPFGFALAVGVLLLGVFAYYQGTPVAKVTQVRAQVSLEHGGKKVTVQIGQALYPGDVLNVPANGSATLAWAAEPTYVDLAANTELHVLNPMRGKRLALRTGFLQAEVAAQPQWRPMIITTPLAEAKVVGTQFSLSAAAAVSRLEVLEGAVLFRKTKLTAADARSEVTVRAGEVADASPGVKLAVQYLTGFLSSDLWAVPPGTPFRDAPARGTLLNQSRSTARGVSHLIERLQGYLVAPATGDYTFWIASFSPDTAAELWLSANEEPTRKRQIAFYVPPGANPSTAAAATSGPERKLGLTAARRADWNRAPSQKSESQWLVQGRRYYLEVWHEGADIRSVSLGWVMPGQPQGTPPRTIDLQTLSPYVPSPASGPSNSVPSSRP